MKIRSSRNHIFEIQIGLQKIETLAQHEHKIFDDEKKKPGVRVMLYNNVM